MGEIVTEVSSVEQFNQLLSNNEYVVVDFYAEWCGPCKMLSPKLHELASKESNVKFLKVNIENANLKSLAESYKVTAMPTLFFIKNGTILSKVVGANLTEISTKIKSLQSSQA